MRTGASTYFNNDEQPISMLHILASASLPPGFPPTEIDGDTMGTVLSSRTHPCNMSSIPGSEIVRLFSRSIFGTFVIHDWGSALGFDWANRHREAVKGIAYMEAILRPQGWDHWDNANMRPALKALRSEAGEEMVLRDNFFIEEICRKPSFARSPPTRWRRTGDRSPNPARGGGRC